MQRKIFFIFIKFSFSIAFLIITFASILSIYNNKSTIKRIRYSNNIGESVKKPFGTKKDKEWAKKIMQGGYILHFRHAERDKWIDVHMYDSLESDVHDNGIDQTRYAENDYFKNAVCLNERGVIQARAMGEHLKNINFPIGVVVSSTSCRARQTAELAFDGFDKLKRDLVHAGPYSEDQILRTNKLQKLYLNLPTSKSKNTIISGHQNPNFSSIFTNQKGKELSLGEGGFFVISKKDDKLYLEHKFYNFNTFIKHFYQR